MEFRGRSPTRKKPSPAAFSPRMPEQVMGSAIFTFIWLVSIMVWPSHAPHLPGTTSFQFY